MRAGRIAGALLTVVLLAACTPTPEKKGPTLGPGEYSRLDDAGIAQIEEHRFARFDVRDGTLLPTDVGLAADDTSGPIIGDPSKPEMTVEIVGPHGTETITTRTLSVQPGERSASIRFFRDPVDRAASAARLREDQTVWGIQAKTVDYWLAATADPTVGQDRPYKAVLGEGVGRSGLVGSVQASLKNGVEIHDVLILLGAHLYTPEALKIIRSTGSTVDVPRPH
ncbi:hypothetical protein [Actinoplanes utahensis]|uniref:Lipoprotein n=1 Tax=Actinoplanes utahensis TaxID=1869 RepID=A0A0A6XCR7_ACTUT|nr:hypothetical protein [Actinoplanes utahensis]KHD77837.1 hypothetical protein MB27_08570 [Actinoplanes utahensis]GIF32490.1 hypothetical protein Aut01nite_54760 [Actinoplanes utahensis]